MCFTNKTTLQNNRIVCSLHFSYERHNLAVIYFSLYAKVKVFSYSMKHLVLSIFLFLGSPAHCGPPCIRSKSHTACFPAFPVLPPDPTIIATLSIHKEKIVHNINPLNWTGIDIFEKSFSCKNQDGEIHVSRLSTEVDIAFHYVLILQE